MPMRPLPKASAYREGRRLIYKKRTIPVRSNSRQGSPVWMQEIQNLRADAAGRCTNYFIMPHILHHIQRFFKAVSPLILGQNSGCVPKCNTSSDVRKKGPPCHRISIVYAVKPLVPVERESTSDLFSSQSLTDGVCNQRGRHISADLPRKDGLSTQIQYSAHVQHAARNRNVGDARHSERMGLRLIEVPIQQIGIT